ncbi:hypothetical protein [Prevotella sp. 10(H)]|uniref:hypothetical protein n=1 Tax=Prevotella sp. 10(H) TaxID=1158294 RepID=UPI0004A76366|nr:hypothetical protein [Prevotella sp. 10(H)]
MKLKLSVVSLLVIISIYLTPAYSQITIGSSNEPIKAAILDIKQKQPTSDNETATKGGLLMPRVILVNLNSLAPLLETALANDNEQKLLHTGLVVYNINGAHPKGMYYWTGIEWKLILGRDVTGMEPWNKVGTTTSSELNTDDSYLNAKAVINGTTTHKINGGEDAILTVTGGDASINGITVGKGKGNIGDNTAVGQYSLRNATAGGSNTAIGNNSLAQKTTGGTNTAIGYGGLSAVNAASDNTAVGFNAGSNITTGQNNLTIGYQALAPVATSSSQINIGNALFGIQGSTIADGKVGVGIATPTATLHVDGSMSLTDAPLVTGKVLVVDSDGKVGIRETTPIQYIYVQSTQQKTFNSTELNTLNSTSDLVVPWLASDMFSNNNIVEFVSASNSFKIKRSFAAEISGYVNYRTGAAYPSAFSTSDPATSSFDRDHGSSLLNLKIQISTDDGNTWKDLSNTRGIWTYGALGDQTQTVETPVVIKDLYAGNLIRMVIQRPTSSQAPRMGITHGSTASIVCPPGMKYSRGIRIVGL